MVRKRIVPYWGMFGEFLKAIFSLEGLLQFLGLAVILYLVGRIPMIGGILTSPISSTTWSCLWCASSWRL